MTTFAEALAEVPYQATENEASGLVAPIFRAVGHVMYTLGAQAEPSYTLSQEELINELSHASAHLSRTIAALDYAPISGLAKTRIRSFVELVDIAAGECREWEEETRISNLRALGDRAASLGSFFDLELAGVPNSNPGRSL